MQPAKLLEPPRPEDVQASINACLANGDRMMNDALQLEFQEEGGARLAICLAAKLKDLILSLPPRELLSYIWSTTAVRVHLELDVSRRLKKHLF